MKYIFSILIFSLLACCSDDIIVLNAEQQLDALTSDSVPTDKVAYHFGELPDNNAINDYFDIISIIKKSGELHVTVDYSGGCKEHNFNVWWNGTFLESDPMQLRLGITHNANDDLCEALVRETIIIDLTEAFAGNPPQSPTHMDITNLSKDQTIRIDALLDEIEQGATCDLNVTFDQVICGDGLFGANWFKLDGFDYYDEGNLLLQPVAASEGVDIPSDLSLGDYKIGIEIMHGFVFNSGKAICMAYPGPSVPIKITCIEAR
ncbi:MAG TPA: hypothetical protein ACFCUD_14550 [Cyclobacteriaceae bacterium]